MMYKSAKYLKNARAQPTRHHPEDLAEAQVGDAGGALVLDSAGSLPVGLVLLAWHYLSDATCLVRPR